MIHLIHHNPHRLAIEEALIKENGLAEAVYFLEDDYSIGPLEDLDGKEEKREQFWQILKPYIAAKEAEQESSFLRDKKILETLLQRLKNEPNTSVCIWFANNAPETSFYLRVISFFKAVATQLRQIHIDNLPFFSSDGKISFPKQLAEIEPNELRKCMLLIRQPSAAEIEIYLGEWDFLKQHPSEIRTLKSPKLLESDSFSSTLDMEIKQILRLYQKPMRLNRMIKDIHKKMGNIAECLILQRVDKLLNNQEVLLKGERQKHFTETEIQSPTAHYPA